MKKQALYSTKIVNSVALKTAVLMMAVFLLSVEARAIEPINIEKLANAIYKAENSIKYPYGIVSINTRSNKEYARKICINTINHALRDWNKQGDFIEFLGKRYCPTQGKYLTNDEKRLNKYWVKNVKFFYKK